MFVNKKTNSYWQYSLSITEKKRSGDNVRLGTAWWLLYYVSTAQSIYYQMAYPVWSVSEPQNSSQWSGRLIWWLMPQYLAVISVPICHMHRTYLVYCARAAGHLVGSEYSHLTTEVKQHEIDHYLDGSPFSQSITGWARLLPRMTRWGCDILCNASIITLLRAQCVTVPPTWGNKKPLAAKSKVGSGNARLVR